MDEAAERKTQSALRTVVQMGPYLQQLKQAAQHLSETIEPEQRGYFTPAEIETLQGLLVSYRNTRNALFEVISEMREVWETRPQDQAGDAPPWQRCFLAGYAAGLLLVDAARFLRELADHRPVVREKLNEPMPEFEIEAGFYRRVQRSLLHPRHAWHLYHASRYYNEFSEEIRNSARSRAREDVCDVVDQLQQRLRVSWSEFAQARLRRRGRQVYRGLLQGMLGRALYGLQKLGGSLVADKYLRRGHQPCLPPAVATELLMVMQPGDVLVVRKEYALTNYFLPGHWPHAALYLGPSDYLTQGALDLSASVRVRWPQLCELAVQHGHNVIEAMRDGVLVRGVGSPFGSDSVVLLRPRLDAEQIRQAVARVLTHEGKPYDFDFDFRRADRLVCTEVVYRAYDGVGGMALPLTSRAGRPTLSGSDLIQLALSQRSFDVVAVYDQQASRRLQVQAPAVETVRNRMSE